MESRETKDLTKKKQKKKKKKTSTKNKQSNLFENYEKVKIVNEVEEESEKGKLTRRKRKMEKANNVDVGKALETNNEDKSNKTTGENKKNKLKKKKRESEEQTAGEFGRIGNSKKAKKKKKEHNAEKEAEVFLDENEEAEQDTVYHISSGDEDSSKGMKKWITEYHQRRLGLKVLQQQIDEFITAYEAKLEQEKKEREARDEAEGWTVVSHHKGRKRTADSESGITMGSISLAAVTEMREEKEKKMQKKLSESLPEFYRFQRKEAKMNEILSLQSKFEQDKKKIQQMRAARKFRP